MVRIPLGVTLVLALFAAAAIGQTPQPFPRPGQPRTPDAPARPQPAPELPAPDIAPAPQDPAPQQMQTDGAAPSAAQAYFPIYPTAQFIAAYDAGRGQRYLLYGTTASYSDIVAYYRVQLRERGDDVFDEPPTHMFEVGRFRSETMAFPPGVTVKDWTWGGSAGYPNPTPGGMPERFPTVIMIVPPPPGEATGQ